MKNMYIFCDGGMGNRIGTLVGGLISSEMISANPVICWPENNWCGCSFDDLFETEYELIKEDINTLFKKNENNIFLIHENQSNVNLNKVFRHSLDSLNNIKLYDADIVYYHNMIPRYFNNLQIIQTLDKLKIKKELLHIIKNFIENKKINKNVVGLHFRKTDYPRFMNENEYYERVISTPNQRYFICSDDEKTEKIFNNLNNVITFPKKDYVEKYTAEGGWNHVITDNEGRTFNYNVKRSKNSVIEAFIDMIILSRTNIQVNSPSSFLNFAKLYSNILL